uniref:Uncharacterized protein n=1 Tax=Rhizophora mucronata TaxID=61149 RepID=A0A2P2NPG5_RHIMU
MLVHYRNLQRLSLSQIDCS